MEKILKDFSSFFEDLENIVEGPMIKNNPKKQKKNHVTTKSLVLSNDNPIVSKAVGIAVDNFRARCLFTHVNFLLGHPETPAGLLTDCEVRGVRGTTIISGYVEDLGVSSDKVTFLGYDGK